MPKGVEHAHQQMLAGPHILTSAKRSVMPKGAEHDQIEIATGARHLSAKRSVMPKGVEHWDRNRAQWRRKLLRKRISDAERR